MTTAPTDRRDIKSRRATLADIFCLEAFLRADVYVRSERWLRVTLRGVRFDERALNAFEVFFRPVDFERPGHRVLETLVAFEDFLGAGDAAAGEERCPRSFLGNMRVCKAFPVA